MLSCFGTRSRAARDRGEDREDVPVLEIGVEAVEVADVVVALVDVHELVQRARSVEQVVSEPGITLDERAEHGPDGCALDRDGALTVGLGAEHGGSFDLDRYPDRLQAELRSPDRSCRSAVEL